MRACSSVTRKRPGSLIAGPAGVPLANTRIHDGDGRHHQPHDHAQDQPPGREPRGRGDRAGGQGVSHVRLAEDRATASSTRCTCSPSAKLGLGSVPSAIASTRSRTSWVKLCSQPMMWPGGHHAAR